MALPIAAESDTCFAVNKPPHSRTPVAVSIVAVVCLLVGSIVVAGTFSELPGFVAPILILAGAAAAVLLMNAWRAHRAGPATLQRRVGTEVRHEDFSATASQLVALWEKSPLSIILFEPNDPVIPVKIVDCNPTACEMHGYRPDELVGRSVDIIEARPWARESAQNWIDELRVKFRVEGYGQHRRKDGTIFDIEFFTSLIVINGRELVIGMDRDASASRKAERALRESEERWQLAIAGSNEGVWDWNIETGAVWLSPRWKEMLGFADNEIPNNRENWLTRIHPDDLGRMQAELQRHLRQQTELFQCEYRMRRRDGGLCWVIARGKAHFSSDGRALRMLGTHTDITSQKETEDALRRAKEAAEAADRAKSDFLAVMSHEIRTPMNGVIGFTNLLLDTALTAEQRDWLLTIRSSGESLVTLINDILDFSKIESGHMELERHPLNVRRCLEEVLDLLWSRAGEKKIELLHWIDEDVPDWIVTDGTRLRQVLVNLIGNAIKFTDRGEVEIRVSTVAAAVGGPTRLAFAVRDTGEGIPADRVSRLFKPFSQADSSTTRRYGGTGLGLAISRRLAQLLGGEIELASSSSEGSCFRFTILAPASPAPEGQPAPDRDHRLHIELQDRHALVVDDNETNRRILCCQLDRWGLTCHAFEKPVDAIQYIREGGAADVALLDMMMPDMHGTDLAARLKELRPADLPMVLLSSVSREELRPFDPSNHFDVQIFKPVRQSALLDALHTTLATAGTEAGPALAPVNIAALDHALGRRHPLRILVAEDNVVNQKLITRLLERLGYAPHLVANGLSCLDALRRDPYDLVLMDCQMPEMDGYAAAANIRSGAVGERNRHVPIAALTASAMVGDRERCVDAGMNDYLTKPIQAADIVALIESVRRQDD
jgi:PAS domain S-box-containing protein